MFVARVAATDRDAGDAGRVACVIDQQTDARMFKLFPVAIADKKAEYRLVTSGEAEFDREYVDRYWVTVSCADHGSPSLSANASLEVLVDDVNDNEPRLSRPHYVFRVAENSVPSTQIGTVAAADPDLGPSGSVSFYLESRDAEMSDSDAIQVDPETGVITVEAGV